MTDSSKSAGNGLSASSGAAQATGTAASVFAEIAVAACTARHLLHSAAQQDDQAVYIAEAAKHIVAWIGYLADKGSRAVGDCSPVCGSMESWMGRDDLEGGAR